MPCVRKVTTKDGLIVRCGRCLDCRIAHSQEWAFRIIAELPYHEKAAFATFTYNDENLPADSCLQKKELCDALKRLRRAVKPRRFKYFASGEYGELNGRPHYHAILFGIDGNDRHILEKIWTKGFVHVGNVTLASARYTVDYTLKAFNLPQAVKQGSKYGRAFQVQSKGLGLQFVLDNVDSLTFFESWKVSGKDHPLPRYFKKHLGLDGESSLVLGRMAQEKGEILKKVMDLVGDDIFDVYRHIYASREQSALNTKARVNLKRKGSM